MSVLKIGLLGAKGRMGQAVQESVRSAPDQWALADTLPSRSDRPEAFKRIFEESDVILDFSSPIMAPIYFKLAQETGKPLVVCTTGHETPLSALYKSEVSSVPIVWAPNVSLSLLKAIQSWVGMARLLGTGWDVHISDHHHRYKKDAPSGTALFIAEKMIEECPWLKEKIQFSSIRGGTFSIENTVVFSGDCEVIEVKHRALSRSIFAQGALTLCRWATLQKAGFYTASDWLSDALR